jgi:hypothetical protein
LAIALSACGATPPQAPVDQAAKLDASTSDIATECGLAYQVTAFRGEHGKDLRNLESNALLSVRSLAEVYRGNPHWIYQGETVGEVVIDAEAMLHACGLTRAEQALRHAR